MAKKRTYLARCLVTSAVCVVNQVWEPHGTMLDPYGGLNAQGSPYEASKTEGLDGMIDCLAHGYLRFYLVVLPRTGKQALAPCW